MEEHGPVSVVGEARVLLAEEVGGPEERLRGSSEELEFLLQEGVEVEKRVSGVGEELRLVLKEGQEQTPVVEGLVEVPVEVLNTCVLSILESP